MIDPDDADHPTVLQVRAVFGDAVEVTCLSCPLQVEGTYRETPFYFRARHGRWSLALGPDAVANAMDRQGWVCWGDPEPDDQEDAGTFGTWLQERLDVLLEQAALWADLDELNR